ncbi:N-6 DNA methylase [Flavobacterium psychrophilum]|uniref:N-6 DNA methylase n=1 Tax=Flavobacterium psychrophilum TaxID=96345 RepID=UPI000B7C3C02|nr:N-6 DNA methylase [Flavobacterium psychrophilum]MCB5994069.1 N-6 DNA methylase [Flavobacterium psychrophilum]MCB5997689.1 N-6 DNA methylase [Flavobacterium psychrophilum]MCB6004346.1 N-6 DNA methylase [Flavobacterium psychrophilum]MCB6007466.1 N-6 DNA methylase [Flavobacterium psychrophilum]MCB6019090.1 N-6 DNA methylase [Flavobacterium psychrophilum]
MKDLIKIVGFQAKENASAIYIKKYLDGYAIEIDFDKKTFHFGGKIKIGGKDSQNITKPEDWVVLECVNRLLETGYKPENISLEKVYPAGHGFSGRLDICVNREDGSEYLLIECKTYGKEFDKEFTRIKKDGGQLFTYFKFSNKADVIMLYASQLINNEIIYPNEIVKIEDNYKLGGTKDFYNSWNKKTYQNIVWENKPYNSETKKTFTKNELKKLSKDESDTIFHGFASILRKHSVSDKPNAFNKIFNLFLAKLYDEAKGDDMELEFHWREDDNPIDFQVRLINLHKNGLKAFLEKEIAGIEDSDFEGAKNENELLERKKKILMFNNVFAIKEVDDDETFNNNQRVLKEVVQLLEKYQIRYPRKQQHLSDFFELLLTTGLKQEVGQYFTPPPVTKFIVRSLPIKKMILQEINNQEPKLPAVIDYAAGSGHFITEALEEYQDIINKIDINKELTFPKAKTAVQSWVADPYNWAAKYVYGIEKDYRLVKVAKVGCYFYGDGVAQIIHGDGLDSFATSKTYKGLLQENINIEDSSKAKFSVVISNPPYAVNDCKDDLEYIGAQHEYTLYQSLSDKSKDIECLFVERTKHLLKDGGVASLILPSSILNNTGIQTKTREIILQYFDIVAIAELGSNTFMATGTNTVTLFLRRRANKLSAEWKKSVANFFENKTDITINGIEKPVAKYVNHVWENISFSDYISLLEKTPNEAIQNHEIYKEYRKKLKAKTEKDFWNLLLDREADKLLYFIIAYNQKVVLVKSGQKDIEKRFLGYEFSSRRNSEGMHAMQRGKTVDECTQMYDAKVFDNPEKASTYILKAFNNVNFDIVAKMQNHISRHDLIDMMTFDRVEFEKTISLSVKKKVTIESKWESKRFDEAAQIIRGVTYSKGDQTSDRTNKIILTADNITLEGDFEIKKEVFLYDDFEISSEKKLAKNDIFICFSSGSKEHLGKVAFIETDTEYYAGGFMGIIRVGKENEPKYFFQLLNTLLRQTIRDIGSGSNINNLSGVINDIKIPLPPLDIQQKIVAEIEVLEAKEKKAKEAVEELKERVTSIINNLKGATKKLRDVCKYSETRIKSGLLTSKNYIGVDNMLQNTAGKIDSNFVPDSGTSTEYNAGNILLSNIRPYLKKIWFADNNGGSSGDVLVLQNVNSSVDSKYIYYHLKQDNFFDFEMQGVKGIKMPRGDKQHIMDFKIPLPPLSEQQKIVSEIEKIEAKITTLETEIASIPKQKEAILKKYL